ncbi:Gfo/Idh/MocA family protein [Jannaschia ovalis]|uniref:Gfo/Idh/MocA family oxidoreductase n=1 Tax=Jannaschia ovalis TaxID=3038773 RepID=A0ABY8L8B3_9RHOB|nr:Gfo/Idh/MocA family oxidoreductase [Jannaschia sp. GRR-S6-38]WGH77604.1 Gfo/Idh/MocA family oxidoreductase [Jannaschia sp. GRR-S6-38]
MGETIRWGVLGASKFARELMGPAIHTAPGHALAALATRSPQKAAPFAAMAPGLQVYDGYAALLEDAAIDAVYIPLPHHLHIEWALKALEAGKHVLVEKPVALRADQIAPLIAARDRTGLQCAEAYMMVHHPQWQRLRALLAEGAIGRLRHVEGVFTYDNSADPGNIRNQAEMGGGALPDIGVYTYGATRWATGAEPEAVTHADIDWEDGCDVLARVAARFPGFTAHWVNSMRLLPEQLMLFHGEAGLIRLTAPFNPRVFGEARLELRDRSGVTRIETWPGADHYRLQVEAFGAAIRGAAAFPWTLEDARGTQAVIDMAYAAAGGRPPA